MQMAHYKLTIIIIYIAIIITIIIIINIICSNNQIDILLPARPVVQEVPRLDVPVYDAGRMHPLESL